MRRFTLRDGRLLVNGEALPVSARAIRGALLRIGSLHWKPDGEISFATAQRILELERRRALEILSRLLERELCA